MADTFPIERKATGAACVILDDAGRVLLVHHTHGHLNWELPGGVSDPGEAPDETARRELLEETGLRVGLEQLTGVYYEPHHDFGPMLHFVFRCAFHAQLVPVASSSEISELGYWPIGALPTPISDFTERRIRDAMADGPVSVRRIEGRDWRD